MKLINHFLAVMLAVILPCSTAAAGAQGKAADSAVAPTAENLFAQYAARQVGTASGAYALGLVHARGLAPTSRNAASVRGALSRKITEDEAIALVRILGTLYTFENLTGMNAAILHDLRAHVHSANDGIARAAILALTRTVYTNDMESILSYGSKRKLISKDEHYGELAHALIRAPREKQAELVSLIARERNGYALGILAASVNADAIKRLDPAATNALGALLGANQPMFPMALSEFGFTDVLRYNYWLHATALLHESTGRGSYEAFVLAQLSDAGSDPRQALGFLGSREGQPVIAKTRNSLLLKKAADRAVSYAKSFPQDWLMNQMAHHITQAIGTP